MAALIAERGFSSRSVVLAEKTSAQVEAVCGSKMLRKEEAPVRESKDVDNVLERLHKQSLKSSALPIKTAGRLVCLLCTLQEVGKVLLDFNYITSYFGETLGLKCCLSRYGLLASGKSPSGVH